MESEEDEIKSKQAYKKDRTLLGKFVKTCLELDLESVDEVHDKRVLHSLQNIAFGFGVSRVLLITNNSSLFQYFHSVNFPLVFTTELSYLKHFTVASFTENFA